jgi:hypothetical protein
MHDSHEIEAIRERLSEIVALICQQAEKDHEFQKSLQTILGIKSKNKPKKSKPSYDLFGRYGDLNKDVAAFSQELGEQSHSELVQIASAQKLGTKKELEKNATPELVEKLIQYVQQEIDNWQ